MPNENQTKESDSRITDSKTFWKIIIVVIFAVLAEFVIWWAMIREESLNWWLVTMNVGKQQGEAVVPAIPKEEEVLPPDDLKMEDLDLDLDDLIPPPEPDLPDANPEMN